ncbi:MAG: hypothetical protein KDD62_13670 [Bdellovibrionales bacterium]|nr:hypothetical protein [Bdellovibrionales bacterium]
MTKRKVNKAAAIRQFADSGLRPKQIAEELKQRKIEVEPQYVSLILSQLRRGHGPKKVVTKGKAAKRRTVMKATEPDVTVQRMIAAKQLMALCGGRKEAVKWLDNTLKFENA